MHVCTSALKLVLLCLLLSYFIIWRKYPIKENPLWRQRTLIPRNNALGFEKPPTACVIKMNNQIRHKCGYCGWLFSFTTNFFEHECFKHYVEDKDRIYIDENNVVTIRNTKTAEDPVCTDTLDELLIGAVKARKGLYDHRILPNERTNLRKNALWTEVSNTLGGAFNPEEAKARWKYLRDNYIKARKKVKGYIPSGSAAKTSASKKPKFRFYDIMTFLNDLLETRQ
ncbi:uncharacterized protein [Linepithema humile]|uniref:uncharacterized protein n=1 Tax=Linepithema humile TaxID=83485 RepID=UPI00351E0EFC